MRTQTTNRFLVEDLEDVGRTGELANDRINDELTEPLVKGHEDIFYGYEFAIQGGGEAASRVSPSRRPSASSRTSSAQAPRAWAEQAFPNLSTSTRSTRATTSPPGRSRTSSRPRCGPGSGHCVTGGVRHEQHRRDRNRDPALPGRRSG